MKILDKGIILFSKKLQEKLLLIKIFSEENGICAGVARSVSQKKIADYQIGNFVKFQRYARLDDQLGTVTCECIKSYQWEIMSSKIKLHAFNSMSSLILSCFVDSEPHIISYNATERFMKNLAEPKRSFSWLNYFLFELEVLKDAGYELELKSCAVTAKADNLLYVSPKTGRAISQEASIGYEHLLLKLPNFIINNTEPVSVLETEQAFDLCEYFFNRYIWRHKSNLEVINARKNLRALLKCD